MEIQKVSLGLGDDKKRKVSRKVQKSINEFLSKNGLKVEQLTNEQFKYIKQYVKQKRSLRWVIPVAAISALAVIWALNIFVQEIKSEEGFIFFSPPDYIVVNDETNETIEVPAQIFDYCKAYGKICAVISAVIVGGLYAVATGIGNSIVLIIILRKERRKLEAFLPAVKAANENQQTNIKTN